MLKHVLGDGVGAQKDKYLFREIERMGTLDEEQLNALPSQKLYGGQLSAARYHLIRKVFMVKGLLASGQERNPMSLCQNAQMLLEMGLGRMAARMLKKAEKLALEQEDFMRLIEVQGIRIQFAPLLELKGKALSQIHLDRGRHHHALAEIHELDSLYYALKRSLNLAADWEYAKKLMDEIPWDRSTLSKTAQARRLGLQIEFARGKRDFAQAAAQCRQLLEFFQQHPFLIKNWPQRYRSFQNNLALYLIVAQQFEAADQQLDQLAHSHGKQDPSHMRLRLSLALKRENKEQALEWIENLSRYYKKRGAKANEAKGRAAFWYLAAWTQLYFGRPEAARRSLRELGKTGAGSLPMEMYAAARILQLVCLYEMGQEESLDQEGMYLLRFLGQHAEHLVGATEFVKLIRNLSRLPLGDRLHFLREQASRQVEGWEDLGRHHLCEKFDVKAWIQAQIQGRPMYQRTGKRSAPTLIC